MKRIVLIWMAAFLMGGMAMAQHARHSDKMPEPKVRAERMVQGVLFHHPCRAHDGTDGERVLLERYAETTTAGGKSGIG